MKREKILIVDLDKVQSQRVARQVREANVYCEIYPESKVQEKNDEFTKGIIVANSKKKKIDFSDEKVLNLSKDLSLDEEVQLVSDFLNDLNLKSDWKMNNYKDYIINEIKETVGDGKVLLALSGGVDSSVCAKLISDAIGNQLTCIFVDTGLMRKNEGDEVRNAFKDSNINLISIDAEERFLNRLKGVTDPEKKRKIIGEEFIRVFEEEGKKIKSVDFLAQGTIYPDIIESGEDDETVVKSHHNVGGLPDFIDFKELLEPLKYLFKDEVRELGEEIGLDKKLVWRQPFPGPGLSVRCIGEVRKDKLDILRDADYIFREEIALANLDKDINQYFAVLTDVLSTGNRDGKRSYEYTIALRAIVTKDFMNGKFAEIPFDILRKISKKITDNVSGVNRIVYDITDKPPATIEWE